jgi:hypothetical protein
MVNFAPSGVRHVIFAAVVTVKTSAQNDDIVIAIVVVIIATMMVAVAMVIHITKATAAAVATVRVPSKAHRLLTIIRQIQLIKRILLVTRQNNQRFQTVKRLPFTSPFTPATQRMYVTRCWRTKNLVASRKPPRVYLL